VITRTRKWWIVGIALAAVVCIVALVIAGRILASRFEPYIREQAIAYLEKRFDSDVELKSLHIAVPHISPLKLAWNRGRGTRAKASGEGLSLRHKGYHDRMPMFVMKTFSFEVDLGTLYETQKVVHSVRIDGMEINIPPTKERPTFDSDIDHNTNVLIEEVLITNSFLRILPDDDDKAPLQFDLQRIRLQSAGKDVAMKYDATLNNAKPPGEIQSTGTFGPWAAAEPGDTPLKGQYDFKNADLGVFDGIAGILQSQGQFEGTLDSINVDGQATVPDFRLTDAGNKVPLFTRFKVLVDGTNGNTILKPVVGRLGTTDFTTSGGIIKREKNRPRSIVLDVTMPNGNLRDLLTLAMKGSPFMEGRIRLQTKIDIPPLNGKVTHKLLLDGAFDISNARFLRSNVQQQIDTLSRRGQGKPKDEEIVEVPSGIAGAFKLSRGQITFRSLSFGVPGAGVDLTGSYNLEKDDIDFHGTLKLDAKVSQTFTGWKRWALKPVDPFFSKQGSGTLLHIQITGDSKQPHFGLDHKKKKGESASEGRAKPGESSDRKK